MAVIGFTDFYCNHAISQTTCRLELSLTNKEGFRDGGCIRARRTGHWADDEMQKATYAVLLEKCARQTAVVSNVCVVL